VRNLSGERPHRLVQPVFAGRRKGALRPSLQYAVCYRRIVGGTPKNRDWQERKSPKKTLTLAGCVLYGFPTCDPCEHRGDLYPGLGELRSVRWQVQAAVEDGEKLFVKLFAFGPISPVRAEKTVTLMANSPVLRVHYEIINLGVLPLEFIWGTHPALEAYENLILRIPAKTGIVGQATDPRVGAPGQRYAWPRLESPAGVTDMSRVQGIEAKVACGHYATDLEAGWYAVEDARTGDGFLLHFPLAQCPYLWMWLVYGGWRGYHHIIIIEPWTSCPNKLAEAVQQNTHRILPRGERFSVEVAATGYRRDEGFQGALRRLER
jgi:hypothetical protein